MFNFLSKNIFKNNWKQKFEDPIWKIFPSSKSIILCETRNPDNKITKYHSINLRTGKFIWQDFVLNNKWWIGVEGVFQGVIIFHEYERPDFPIHKSVIAVDLLDQSMLWQLSDVRFVSATEDFIFTASDHLDNSIVYQIDLKSGNIIKVISYNEMISITERYNAGFNKHLKFPMYISIEDISIDGVIKYLSNLKKKIFKYVDILQNEKLIVIGFSVERYDNANSLYDDYISIINSEAKQLFIDQLFINGNQVVSPRYFMDNGCILYIKDKTILNAIYLN